MLSKIGFKIVIFIILPILTVLYFSKCSFTSNKNELHREPKTIIMSSKEQEVFENKFFNLKYNLPIDRVKNILIITPSDELFVYQPAFFKKDSKRVGADLIYIINDKKYELSFGIKNNVSKLFSKSIENISTGEIWWYDNRWQEMKRLRYKNITDEKIKNRD